MIFGSAGCLVAGSWLVQLAEEEEGSTLQPSTDDSLFRMVDSISEKYEIYHYIIYMVLHIISRCSQLLIDPRID